MELERFLALLGLIGFTTLTIVGIGVLLQLKSFIKEASETLKTVAKDINDFKNKSNSAIDDFGEIKNELIHTLKSFDEIKNKSVETLENADASLQQLTYTTRKVDQQIDQLASTFQPYREMVDTVFDKIAPPVGQALSIFSAASKAISAFTKKLAK